MVRINPHNEKRVFQQEAMHSTMLIARYLKLPCF